MEPDIIPTPNSTLNLSRFLKIGKAAGEGDCFFDSIAQGLRAVLPEVNNEITVKSLRQTCKTYAESHVNREHSWLKDALKFENEKIEEYIPRIEFASKDINNGSEEAQILNLSCAVWGRSHIEGRIICEKYNVQLHVIEKHEIYTNGVKQMVWTHEIIDESGMKSVENLTVGRDRTIYVINEGFNHFQPVFCENEADCTDATSHTADAHESISQHLTLYQEDNWTPETYKETHSDFGVKKLPSPSNSTINEQMSELDNQIHFTRRQGTSGIKGQLYEIQLVMLFLLQGIIKKENNEIDSFYLASNMKEAGDFDDVVFKYSYTNHLEQMAAEKTSTSQVIFLQAKHRENSEKDKITVEKLLSEADDGAFNLKSYFSTYRKIKKRFPTEDNPIFKDCIPDKDISFAIYSNAQSTFDDDQVGFERNNMCLNSFLNISQANIYYYKLKFDGSQRDTISKVLHYSSDCRKLAKKLANSITNGENISFQSGLLKEYRLPLTKIILMTKPKHGEFSQQFLKADNYRVFRETFLDEYEKSLKCDNASELDLVSELKKQKIILPGNYGKDVDQTTSEGLPDDIVSDNEINAFLNQLQLYVSQPNEEDLGKLIKKQLKSFYHLDQTEVDTVFSEVKNKIEAWWKNATYFLTETNKFFQNATRREISFDVRDPTELFTGREEQLNDLHEALQRNRGKELLTVISQMTSVAGLGGIGKTELARKYVQQHIKDYDRNVLWINADNYSTLSESFVRLAKEKLKIDIRNPDGLPKDIKSIVEDVYRYFSKRQCLFIFDNAQQYKSNEKEDDGIDKFLPSLATEKTPFILITSRYQEWADNVQVLTLDVFTEEEAARFIRQALQIPETSIETNDILALADLLQRFPLALSQAVAYIRQENDIYKHLGETFSINDYVEMYKNAEFKTKDLLNYHFPHDNGYTRTTFITWKITLQKIKQLEYGDEALDIMDMIAYFAPQNISTKLFLQKICDKRELGSAINLLKQYSMISAQQDEMDIHRVVQQVIRITNKEGKKERNVLLEALKLLKIPMIQNGNNPAIKHISHAISVWKYASDYSDLVREFSEMPSHMISKLDDAARFEEAKHFGTLMNQLLKNVVGENHHHTLATMYNTSEIFYKLGNYEKALDLSKEVYECEKCTLGENHPDTLQSKASIGVLLEGQGKFKDALEMLTDVYSRRLQVSGQNHPSTLYTLNNIGITLRRQGKFEDALKVFNNVLNKRQQTLGVHHLHTLETMFFIGNVLYCQGKYEEAFQTLHEVYEHRKNILGQYHVDTLETQLQIGSTLEKQGNHDEALKMFYDVLDHQKRILGENNPDTLVTEHNIATIHHQLGENEKALETFDKVFNKRQELYGDSNPITLSTMHNIALVLSSQGRYDDSINCFNAVIRKQKNSLEVDNPEILTSQHNLAEVLRKKGDYNEALALNCDVFQKRHAVLGNHHPDTLTTKHNIALLLDELQAHDEALKCYQEVLSDRNNILGVHNEDTLTTKSNLALVLYKLGKTTEALNTFKEVLDIQVSVLGESHFSTLTTKNNIGHTLCAQGNYDEAFHITQGVFNVQKESLGELHPDTLLTKNNLAVILCSQGKLGEALDAFRETLCAQQTVLGETHPQTIATDLNIGGILMKQSNYPEALKTFRDIHKKQKNTFGEDHPDTMITANIIDNLIEKLSSSGV